MARVIAPYASSQALQTLQRQRRRAPQDPRKRAAVEREGRREAVGEVGRQQQKQKRKNEGGQGGEGRRFDGARDGSARDLAASCAVLQKMGAKLPEGDAEVERWVAERKRRWPSRANVERKLREREEREREERERMEQVGKTAGDSVSRLAEDYASSEGEIEEGEGGEGERETGVEKGRVGKVRKCRKRGRGKGRGRGRKGESTVGDGRKEKTSSFFERLVRQQMQLESATLLQAFAYIARKKRDMDIK